MNITIRYPSKFVAWTLAVLLPVSSLLCGCGGRSNSQTYGEPPPFQRNAPSRYPSPAPPKKSGMSTGKKIALLVGTAALIYLYNKHKNSKGKGAQGQYYRSRNGRVYYRDAQGNPVWVTPPKEGIRVSEEERDFYERAAQRDDWDTRYTPSDNPAPSRSRPSRSY